MDKQARGICQTTCNYYARHQDYRYVLASSALRAQPMLRFACAGICFGHQIVARAFGGDSAVVPNGGKWEVGIEPVKLTTLGKRIFGTEADIVRRDCASPGKRI